jgi:hypothetical protein
MGDCGHFPVECAVCACAYVSAKNTSDAQDYQFVPKEDKKQDKKSSAGHARMQRTPSDLSQSMTSVTRSCLQALCVLVICVLVRDSATMRALHARMHRTDVSCR